MFEFDVLAFLKSGAENAPAVIFLVLAWTYLAGKFGMAGKAQLGVALVLGALLGGGAQVATLGYPAGFGGWFALILYALVMAVTPSLLYDQGKEVIAKTTAKLIGYKPPASG